MGGGSSSQSTSTTNKNTTTNNVDNRVASGGGSIGGNVNLNLSDASAGGAGGVHISTTDQGAVNAGLKIALAGLDHVESENRVNAQVTQDAIDKAVGVASTVAQGQQNVTFKYVTWILLGIAGAGVLYAYVSHGRRS